MLLTVHCMDAAPGSLPLHARCRAVVHTSLPRFAPSRDNPKVYATDYDAVFVGAVREALLSVDPDVIFVDSSPSKGLLSQAPYVKRHGPKTASHDCL